MPLSRDQGYPIDWSFPACMATRWKWVNEVTVMNHVVPGYWEQNGYDVDAYIGTSSGLQPPPMSERVVRFNRTERWVHAVQAVTFLLLLLTRQKYRHQRELDRGMDWHRALLREIHPTTAFFRVFGPGSRGARRRPPLHRQGYP